MQENKRRCFRCRGRTKLFKIAGAYSMQDTGGKEVKCPLCAGTGEIDTQETIDAKLKASEGKKRGRPKKEENDEEKKAT